MSNYIDTGLQTTYAQLLALLGDFEDNQTIQEINARIAAMEHMIINSSPPAGDTNAQFPYDKDGLEREFIDDVLSLLLQQDAYKRNLNNNLYVKVTYQYTYIELLSSNVGTKTAVKVIKIGDYFKIANDAFFTEDKIRNVVTPQLTAWANSELSSPPAVVQSSSVTSIQLMEASSAPNANASGWLNIEDALAEGLIATQDAGTFQSFDQLDFNQKLQLLNSDGRNILRKYRDLLKQVFAVAEKNKENPREINNNGVPGNYIQDSVVTAIAPFELNGTIYNYVARVREQDGSYGSYLITDDIVTYQVEKNVVYYDDGTPATFTLGFDKGLVTTSAQYMKVEWDKDQKTWVPSPDNQSSQPIALPNIRTLNIMEYLYYWNEARIKILRAQMLYQEGVVKEIQSDLADANKVLATLEKQASETTAQDKDGKPNPNSSDKTNELTLFELRVNTADSRMFPVTSNGKYNYGQWAEARTQLKNYIDRKSAQAQQAMLDYQDTLNRYNSAFEIMAKLQEKLDGMLKSNLRNLA